MDATATRNPINTRRVFCLYVEPDIIGRLALGDQSGSITSNHSSGGDHLAFGFSCEGQSRRFSETDSPFISTRSDKRVESLDEKVPSEVIPKVCSGTKIFHQQTGPLDCPAKGDRLVLSTSNDPKRRHV
jgi:hypothetical protein